MTAGNNFSRGAIVLVPFPFTDQSGSKVRPALVVSADSFNSSHSDVVLAAITTQRPAVLTPQLEITLDHADVATGRIKQACIVKVAKIFTCEKGKIHRQVATLQSVKLGEILAGLRTLFS